MTEFDLRTEGPAQFAYRRQPQTGLTHPAVLGPVIAALISGLFLFGIGACNRKSGGGDPTPSPENTHAASPTPGATASPTPSPSATPSSSVSQVVILENKTEAPLRVKVGGRLYDVVPPLERRSVALPATALSGTWETERPEIAGELAGEALSGEFPLPYDGVVVVDNVAGEDEYLYLRVTNDSADVCRMAIGTTPPVEEDFLFAILGGGDTVDLGFFPLSDATAVRARCEPSGRKHRWGRNARGRGASLVNKVTVGSGLLHVTIPDDDVE